MKHKIKHSGGFTLIEVLIYSVLLGIFLGSVIILVGNIFASTDTTLARNEVVANQEFIEQKLQWLINQAVNVTSPTPHSTSTQLRLIETAVSINPALFTFDADSDQIMLSLGRADSVSLVSNRVMATDFVVEHFINNKSVSMIKVSLGLRSALYSHIVATTTLSYVLPH